MELLAKLAPQQRHCGESVIFLGDALGKGPDPLGALCLSRQTIDEVGGELLVGNHEATVITWLAQREKDVPASQRRHLHDAVARVDTSLSAEEAVWLRGRPHALELPEHRVIAVHAGPREVLPLLQQRHVDMESMRSLLPDGTPTKATGNSSWAAHWRGPEHVVFCHDEKRRLQLHANATGIDTACTYDDHLSVLAGTLVYPPMTYL